MSETSAVFFLTLLGGYFSIGLVFAIAFVTIGLARIDAAAADAGIGFRVLILPGAALFWPLLVSRWMRGIRVPPDERSAHLCATRRERK